MEESLNPPTPFICELIFIHSIFWRYDFVTNSFSRTDDLKDGTFVGEDKYGNKYYENDRYFLGKNRWVRYNPNVHLEYEGSMVPAEWFGWLHNKTDFPPTVVSKGFVPHFKSQSMKWEKVLMEHRSFFFFRFLD